MIGTKNVMLTVIWRVDGFHVVDMMPPGGRINTKYFLTHIMDSLLAKGFPEGKKPYTSTECLRVTQSALRGVSGPHANSSDLKTGSQDLKMPNGKKCRKI
jgi:hypothetical protein